MQLLASCIDKGDLSSLHSLRWEPPADSSPATASEGAQKLTPTENIIHVPPLDPGMGVGHQGSPGPCPPQAIRKAVPLAGEEKQKDGGTGQLWKPEAAGAVLPVPGAPELQTTTFRVATAGSPSLHQHVLHKQGPTPGATFTSFQNILPQAAVTTTGTAHTRPVTEGDPRISPAPRKVSGEQEALPRGMPRGWVTVQDGVYTAHPVRTFDSPGGVQSSEREPPPPGQDTACSVHIPDPLQEGPGQSVGPRQEKPEGCTQTVQGPPEKDKAGHDPRGPQVAEATLKAHHTLVSGPQAAGASLHSHNSSVPPPPPLSAAVTGPDLQGRAQHDADPIGQASKPAQFPILHSSSSLAGLKICEDPQTETLKLESTRPPRKKPQLPPKPAHLSQIPPPQRLPKLQALSHGLSKEVRQGEYKGGERHTTTPQPAKAPTTGQGCKSLPKGPTGWTQPTFQHGTSTMAPRSMKSQAVDSGFQNPEPPKASALSSGPVSPQQGPSPPGERPVESSHPGAPGSLEKLQGCQQELWGLMNQVQALEKEAACSMNMGALQRLNEEAPQLRGVPQVPASPCKTELPVEQAFGELTRVSTEVARLKEQTLARLLDIEAAVHKALSSMSSLQPEAGPGDHAQGKPEDPGAHRVSVMSKARPNRSGQENKDQTEADCQAEAACHTEGRNQTKVRGHPEVKGQAASTTLSTRRLETLGEDSGLPRVLPSTRDTCSSPTFISIESTTRKLPEMPSPKDNLDVSHSTQDKTGIPQCSGQLRPAPASGHKSILELQTRPGSSQRCGATRTVTEQYEEVDEFGNTIMSSSIVTEQTELPRVPGVHLGLHTSPSRQQFLHRGLAEP